MSDDTLASELVLSNVVTKSLGLASAELGTTHNFTISQCVASWGHTVWNQECVRCPKGEE